MYPEKQLAPKEPFASSHPFVSKEWNIRKNGNLLPVSIRSASKRAVWWICKEGHEWEARVYLRSKGLGKCPICPGRKLSEVNNLKAKHDEIATDLVVVLPNNTLQ